MILDSMIAYPGGVTHRVSPQEGDHPTHELKEAN